MIKRFFTTVNAGSLIVIIGFLFAVPLYVLPFYPDEVEYWHAFAIPSAASIIFGFLIWFWRKSKTDDDVTHWRSNMQKGSLTVIVTWAYAFTMGAVPYIIAEKLNPLLAMFESISGWTTTGFTVIDVTATPKILLFYRSFTQFCGGVGFVIVVLLFMHGKQAMNLYNSEGNHETLIPNLKKTAQTILLMYMGLMLLGTLLYALFGMSWFDAFNHAMCSLSTSGFSTKPNGVYEYNSIGVETVTIALMLIGTTNFAVWLLLLKRKWKQFTQLSEIRFMVIILLVAIIAITLSVIKDTGMEWYTALRHSSFNVISAASTTGYDTIPFDDLSQFSVGILIILMIIGGGQGSTSGGIKMLRAYVMFRITAHNLVRKMSPSRQVKSPHYERVQEKVSIDETVISEVTGYFLTYMAILVIGTLALTVSASCSLFEAGFVFTSALGTTGVSPNIVLAASNAATLLIIMGGMILGRLEIFIVLIGIHSLVKISNQKIAGLLNGKTD